MKTMTSIFERIKQIADEKKGDLPVENWDDMKARLDRESEAKQREHFAKQFAEAKLTTAIGRSGLQGKHLDCTFDNYQVYMDTNGIPHPNQDKVVRFSKHYVNTFGQDPKHNFIFLGASRTGKNHLSAAICNELISRGVNCLVITVTELNMKIKSTYSRDSKVTEEQILKDICNYDLLILDEVGISHDSTNLKVMINYIIDQRSINNKATGVLSNLAPEALRAELGDRVANRLKERGRVFKFDWAAFEFDFGEDDF